MIVSVIIRTYNEEKYIEEVLRGIGRQEFKKGNIEVIIVDSGSTDRTRSILRKYEHKIVDIKKEEFSFGRALNIGCDSARGDFFVFVSGHCIPVTTNWLENIIKPLGDGLADYSYGRQVGRDSTKFSEQCIFDKHFPAYSKIPQKGFFCNNANAAISKEAWRRYLFNEEITGLEDMYLAKRLVTDGGKVAYIADAPVYHIHDESWLQVKTRYEREAFALQQIIPDIHFNLSDLFKYSFVSICQDIFLARKKRVLIKNIKSIIFFRVMQYWGGYVGHHEHRKISQEMKYRYFYPKDTEKGDYEKEDSRSVADEG